MPEYRPRSNTRTVTGQHPDAKAIVEAIARYNAEHPESGDISVTFTTSTTHNYEVVPSRLRRAASLAANIAIVMYFLIASVGIMKKLGWF